ncbi:MAG: hypothetical protein BWY83_03110 [bacterium ADurb.Bin478]|nr:MAG: hypothetical protein BWY83_03110 [bacterium ADurb.Bin478]
MFSNRRRLNRQCFLQTVGQVVHGAAETKDGPAHLISGKGKQNSAAVAVLQFKLDLFRTFEGDAVHLHLDRAFALMTGIVMHHHAGFELVAFATKARQRRLQQQRQPDVEVVAGSAEFSVQRLTHSHDFKAGEIVRQGEGDLRPAIRVGHERGIPVSGRFPVSAQIGLPFAELGAAASARLTLLPIVALFHHMQTRFRGLHRQRPQIVKREIRVRQFIMGQVQNATIHHRQRDLRGCRPAFMIPDLYRDSNRLAGAIFLLIRLYGHLQMFAAGIHSQIGVADFKRRSADVLPFLRKDKTAAAPMQENNGDERIG